MVDSFLRFPRRWMLVWSCVIVASLFLAPCSSQRILSSRYQVKTYRIGSAVIEGQIIETVFDSGS